MTRPHSRHLVPGLLVLLLGVSIASAPGAPPPPKAAAQATPPALAPAPAAPREVEVARSGALETSVAHLPGRLLAAAVARDAAGRYGLVLLVAEAPGAAAANDPDRDAADAPETSGPRSLLFLVPGIPALERLATDVPERVNAVAALASSAGGADRLILGEPGILYALDPNRGGGAGTCRKLLAAPGLDLRSLHGESPGAPWPRLPWLAVARAGSLELLAGDPSPAALRELRPLASFPLPLTGERAPWGIKLTSSPVHLLAEPAAPPPAPPAQPATSDAAAAAPSPASELAASRFAVGPEPQGKHRLRTLLLAATASQAPVEAWSLLPGEGQILDSSYIAWSGRPALVVSSVAKFGIFAKRDLQLYLLARDRSRSGAPPAFAVHTECLFWHDLGAYFGAAGGRGRDLVLIYPEGMRGKKLHFLVYADQGQGRLASQPRVSSVDVEADDWFYGADFTGDGISDLLVESKGRLLLYPGVANAFRLADRPAWSFTLPAPLPRAKPAREVHDQDQDEDRQERPSHAAGARLAGLADLRGDGHPTLFLGLADDRGRTALVAVRRNADLPR